MKRSIVLIASLIVMNVCATVNDDFLAAWPVLPDIDFTAESFVKGQEVRIKDMQDYFETVTLENLTQHDEAIKLYMAALTHVVQEAQKIESTSKKAITLSKVLTQADGALISLNDSDIVNLVKTSSFGLAGAYQRYVAAWAVLVRDLEDTPVSKATHIVVEQSIKPLPYDILGPIKANNDAISATFYTVLESLLFEKSQMKKMGIPFRHLEKEVFSQMVPAKAADIVKRVLPKECALSLNFKVTYLSLHRRLFLEDLNSMVAMSQLSNYSGLLQKKALMIADKKMAVCGSFFAVQTLLIFVLDALAFDGIAQKAQPAAH